ncbi:MAG: NAD(P)/FAD-dependent oxidoreductase [candidate division WOR-3 bacterium]
MRFFTVLIIGAGPAGVACALQLKKRGVDFALFEQRQVGGLVRNAFLISNYPGFPNGISGEDFSNLLRLQLKRSGVKIFFERVERVDPDGEFYIVHSDSNIYRTKFVVIATGTLPKKIPVHLSNDASGRLFYEVVDIPEIVGRDFVIIGSGDAAFDYSLSIVSKGAKSVKILLRGDFPSCNNDLLNRVKNEASISVLSGILVSDISLVGEKVLLKGGSSCIFEADYVVCAIGRKPNLGVIEHFCDGSSNIRENIFIVGDATGRAERYVGLAVSDGILTAERIFRLIKSGG